MREGTELAALKCQREEIRIRICPIRPIRGPAGRVVQKRKGKKGVASKHCTLEYPTNPLPLIVAGFLLTGRLSRATCMANGSMNRASGDTARWTVTPVRVTGEMSGSERVKS